MMMMMMIMMIMMMMMMTMMMMLLLMMMMMTMMMMLMMVVAAAAVVVVAIFIGVDLSSILGRNQHLGKGVNPGGLGVASHGFWGVECRRSGSRRGSQNIIISYNVQEYEKHGTRFKASADFWEKSNHLSIM